MAQRLDGGALYKPIRGEEGLFDDAPGGVIAMESLERGAENH